MQHGKARKLTKFGRQGKTYSTISPGSEFSPYELFRLVNVHRLERADCSGFSLICRCFLEVESMVMRRQQ